MPLFRKKPITVEAMQLKVGCVSDVIEWLKRNKAEFKLRQSGLYIETLEGEMRANLGDWIIKGVEGEFYPCKPDIFEKTYEPVK